MCIMGAGCRAQSTKRRAVDARRMGILMVLKGRTDWERCWCVMGAGYVVESLKSEAGSLERKAERLFI